MIIKIPFLISMITISLNFLATCSSAQKAKILNFKLLTEFSTHAVKELHVHGLDNVVPSIKEAKKSIRDLYKINEINLIKDESKRNDAWAENLKLKELEVKLLMIDAISHLEPDFQHKVLDNGGDLIATMTHLSMLDTLNRKSPLYGTNYDTIVLSMIEEEENILKMKAEDLKKLENQARKHEHMHRKKKNVACKKAPTCIKPKPKFNRNNRAMRLVYSKVIPPKKRLPDSHKVVFTDKKGRTCYCSC